MSAKDAIVTMVTRRKILRYFGASSIAPLAAVTASVSNTAFSSSACVPASSSVRLAAAFRVSGDDYRARVLDTEFSSWSSLSLPGRGHDCVFSPSGHHTVVFSRRPGNWFVVYDCMLDRPVVKVSAAPGRHFYGHGRFSPDGRLFYATENDYENAQGVIGVYQVAATYSRKAEFPSQGVGPHDITALPNSTVLVIANGGIETHPDFGREKLNLATMQSSLAYIDSRTGELTNIRNLPESLQRLSIRHMALSRNGDCFFAAQYEGAAEDSPPLVGCSRQHGGFELWESALANQTLKNHVTSIAVDPTGTTVATTSAQGGAVIFWDAASGKILTVHELPDCSGVAATDGQIYVTSAVGIHMFSLAGTLLSNKPGMTAEAGSWDEHLAITSN